MPPPDGKPAKRSFQSPKGTRDFYPIELARRRFIEDKWRKVAIRHGFDEIDGPTFEHLDLYTVKSGEGIVSELFSFQRAGGETAYALRPEFTPTLARMYAARAGQMPKPTKWFWQSTCFRAENPQRGRLREFMQWNCDVIGDSSAIVDVETIAVSVGAMESMGLAPTDVTVRLSNRSIASTILTLLGVPSERHDSAIALIDRFGKMVPAQHDNACASLGFGMAAYREQAKILEELFNIGESQFGTSGNLGEFVQVDLSPLRLLHEQLRGSGLVHWCKLDMQIARGLAYYTGMVFEVHEATGAERAIAGGGRYDNLIEMFGGPPTPAVGFGMGDVVLSLVLQDKGLMPSDKVIARELGLRPDVFVISNGQPESDGQVSPLLAKLRREGMHARRSYKATKNIGKLLKEAADADARFAVIVESATEVTLKDMDANTQEKGPTEQMLGRIKPQAMST